MNTYEIEFRLRVQLDEGEPDLDTLTDDLYDALVRKPNIITGGRVLDIDRVEV